MTYDPEKYKDRDERLARLRAEVLRRIRDGEVHRTADEHADRGTIPDSNFYRPTQRSAFALHMRLNGHDFFLPLMFIVIGTDDRAWRANREESIAILRNEEKWNDGLPVWAQVTPTFSLEDQMYLREMQLFKSGDDHGTY